MQSVSQEPGLSRREKLLARWRTLKQERLSWESHWRDVADQMAPDCYDYQQAARNKGQKLHWNIINNTPLLALRVLQSGMMSGLTSPSRPWVRFSVADPEMNEVSSVREWLHAVEEIVRETMAKSNLYTALPTIYRHLGGFGTACVFVEDDAERTFRAAVLPVGSYAFAVGDNGRAKTLFRSLNLSVEQLIEKFGEAACSRAVIEMYRRGEMDRQLEVLHAVYPNPVASAGQGLEWKPYLSCWLEVGSEDKGLLSEGGYYEFPAMCPRWSQSGSSVYGRGPGMDALGDSRALQELERRKGKIVAKIVNPPMKVPSSLLNRRVDTDEGGRTHVDQMANGAALEPAITIRPDAVSVVELSIREHEGRIRQALYADLWLMLSGADRTMTAREVAERHEEKLLQLGPVVEQTHTELLDPMFDRILGILQRRGMLPMAPQEIQGQTLKIEYTSVMAQAQKLMGIGAVDRLVSVVAQLASLRPDVLDKLNTDELVDTYADMLGTRPALVVADEDVAVIRQARAKMQALQAQAAQAQQTAGTLSDVASAARETGGSVRELLGSISGLAGGDA